MSGSQWTVAAADASLRLDKYLAAPERAGSRARAAAALERGKVFVCPGRLPLVALIRETAVILRILRPLGLPDEVPVMRPARAPPWPLDGDDDRQPSDC